LNHALDINHGGELAKTLSALYEYMDRRLMESNLRKTADGLKEARALLNTLRAAWAEMLQTPGRSTSGRTAALAA